VRKTLRGAEVRLDLRHKWGTKAGCGGLEHAENEVFPQPLEAVPLQNSRAWIVFRKIIKARFPRTDL